MPAALSTSFTLEAYVLNALVKLRESPLSYAAVFEALTCTALIATFDGFVALMARVEVVTISVVGSDVLIVLERSGLALVIVLEVLATFIGLVWLSIASASTIATVAALIEKAAMPLVLEVLERAPSITVLLQASGILVVIARLICAIASLGAVVLELIEEVVKLAVLDVPE